jgi:hypothetical protein
MYSANFTGKDIYLTMLFGLDLEGKQLMSLNLPILNGWNSLGTFATKVYDSVSYYYYDINSNYYTSNWEGVPGFGRNVVGPGTILLLIDDPNENHLVWWIYDRNISVWLGFWIDRNDPIIGRFKGGK